MDKFYKKAGVENNIRIMAKHHNNSYHFCIFACCRELFNKTKHSNGMSKEQMEKIKGIIKLSLIENFNKAMEKKFKYFIQNLSDTAEYNKRKEQDEDQKARGATQVLTGQ